jgi:hypothetical protein
MVDGDLLHPCHALLVLAQTSEKDNYRISLVESPMVSGSWSTCVFFDVHEGEAISRMGDVHLPTQMIVAHRNVPCNLLRAAMLCPIVAGYCQ